MPETIAQPNLEGITELEDGSALVTDLPEEEEAGTDATDFYANLAESLPPFELNSIASTLLDLIEKDKEARTERDKQQEEGIRRTGLGDDAPGGASFDGASKIVHPLMAEGCVDFAARAIKELFPSNGPVRTKVIGESNEQNLDKARKKRDFLNFYLVERMPEYRSEKEILLTQLPLGGSQYEKYWFDGKRIRMEFVPIDKVYLPYSANSFYTTPRLTHQRELTEEKIDGLVESGFYKDVFGMADQSVEESSSQEANNKIEGKEATGYNEDGQRIIYEVSCNYDAEGNGVAPYVIHIDESTHSVCGLYRNWAESDEEQTPLDWWVEDKFIPWRGAYGIGLPHLIGGMAASLTGALRALLDSAHINNSPSAVKLKGGRTSGQNVSVELTSVTELEAPPNVDDIRKLLMPLPFNPPSNVLFQLLDWITGQAKGVVATAEEKIADASNNMPVGTALALIEQGSQVFSSIHARLHDSQRRALKIICRLIASYPEHALADLGRFGLTPQDFLESDDIAPVSDPNIFSETQRFAQMQSVLQLASGDAADPTIPWNKLALRRRMLELLRVDGVDELLPKPPQPLTDDPVKENIAAMHGTQLLANIVQDHTAHIKTHLMFILQPIVAQSDGTSPQFLAMLLAHVQDHMLLSYQHEVQAASQVILFEATQQGIPLSPDQIASQANQAAIQSMAEFDQAVIPLLKQASDLVKSKQPPPPVDPAIQKTFEAAMAEIQRKSQVDQAEQSRKDKAQQFEQSAKEQELQQAPLIEQIRSQFEAKLEVERMQREDDRTKFEEMMATLRNDADNKNHQITELLKNRDDNETKKEIEMLKAQLTQVTQMAPTEAPAMPDFTPMMQEMQKMLGDIEKAKTNDALTATLDGLRAIMGQLNAPTELVRDANGRAVGMRKMIGNV